MISALSILSLDPALLSQAIEWRSFKCKTKIDVFQWGEKHVNVYVLVGRFKSELELFLITKKAASKRTTKANPGDLFTCWTSLLFQYLTFTNNIRNNFSFIFNFSYLNQTMIRQ